MDLLEARELGYSAGVRHPWEAARLDVVDALIRRYVAIEPGAIVMDIGCGDTFVVEHLATEYTDVVFYAIDTAFTADLIDLYRARLNNPRIVTAASLDAIQPFPETPVSLVLLMDVIEHIADDRGFLTGLGERPFIGPDTKLLVTVPAYQTLFSSHDTFLGHYRRYSNRDLRATLEASGFTVIDIGYFFFSLLPIRALQVMKERLFGMAPERPSSGLVAWNGSAARAALLRRLLAMDARISMGLCKAGIGLGGLSNYAVCTKSV